MKSGYISYFEGYDAKGYAIYNGNGAVTVEHDETSCADPVSLKDEHTAYLLAKAKETNGDIVRIVIKNLMKV